ncbi:MAG TPA: amidohydrolase family protein [Planctomycetota bacterium]|nr:amidohydrolase family protein [Planctomycetota bacterium]
MTELRGRLLLDGQLQAGRLVMEGGLITAVERLGDEQAAELPDCIIAPGFIDLHVHGFGGCGPLDDLVGMGRALAREGTTSFQPTLFPDEPTRLGESCAQLADEVAASGSLGSSAAPGAPVETDGRGCLAEDGGLPAAEPVGLHLEGPFVNPQAAGALPAELLAEPSPAALAAILGGTTGDGRGVRTVTLAPELPGSAELAAELVRCGVRVSLGHSRASGAEALAAARAGAVGVTHLFNAMTGVHHRDAGLAGIGLTEDTLFAELIGDLVHVDERAVDLALAARGPGGLCLVSDALRGAGTGCDIFHDHGREHRVRDGAAWIRDGSGAPERLAGSASSQLDMVRTLVGRGVVSPAEALTMAAETPSRALGLDDRGVLEPGRRADLVQLEGGGLTLGAVWVAGRRL